MFSRRFAGALGLLVLAGIAAVACRQSPRHGVQRLAVLPTENLSGNREYDWLRLAVPALIEQRFAGSASVRARALPSIGGVHGFRPDRLLHTCFDVRDGNVVLRAVTEDVAATRTLDRFTATAPADDWILPFTEALGRELGGFARPPGTTNQAALRAYAEALRATSVDARLAALDEALVADPDFAAPRLLKTRALIAAGRTAEAGQVIGEALAAPSNLDPLGVAEFEYLRETLRGDGRSRARALAAWAALSPADSDLSGQAAQAFLQIHEYAEAARWLAAGLRAEPGRTDFWNTRGYALAFAGDFDAAVESLEEYRRRRPGAANPHDSLGEVCFRFGRYSEATAHFLEANRIEPEYQQGAALLKAARARLLDGDADGAAQLFEQYAAQSGPLEDSLTAVRTADWLFETGRRKEAVRQMRDLAEASGSRPAAAVRALLRLAIWSLVAGDREAAQAHAARIDELAADGSAGGAVKLIRLLAQPAANAAIWRQRAAASFPGPALEDLREQAVTYGLLLSGRPEEAIEGLQMLLAKAKPFGGEEPRVLLAGALLATGDHADARRLLAYDPVIQPGEEPLLYPLVFPRILYLRGRLAEESGETAAAVNFYRLFRRYSGELPLLFGEEEEAQEALRRRPAS